MGGQTSNLNKTPEPVDPVKPIKKTTFLKMNTFGAQYPPLLSKNKKEIKEVLARQEVKNQIKSEGNAPKIKKSIYSSKSFGCIKSYGINSFKGYFKRENEDRVSVIINIAKPKNVDKKWPNHLSYFGLFDGHGGNKCCDFLVNNFHKYLIKSSNFPNHIEKALSDAFIKSESEFLNTYAIGENNELLDRSGSCGLVTIIADQMCYIANVGDSRAVLSCMNGKDVIQLTNDHKPNSEKEKKRIKKNGGVVYKTNPLQTIYRVIPGNLSVSRTVGDAEVKIPFYGGKERVIISTPEITKFKIDENKFDFLLMGCDGIFDKSDNVDIIDNIFHSLDENECDLHVTSGKCADSVIKFALNNNSQDNLSAIIISFSPFENFINKNKTLHNF